MNPDGVARGRSAPVVRTTPRATRYVRSGGVQGAPAGAVRIGPAVRASARSGPDGVPQVQQVAELRENPVVVIEHRVYEHRCPICQEIVWRTWPHGVIEGQLFGVRLHAVMGSTKGSLHASSSDLADVCRSVRRRLGWPEATGRSEPLVGRGVVCCTGCVLQGRVTGRFDQRPLYGVCHSRRARRCASHMHVDGSVWKSGGVRAWIGVFSPTAFSFFVIAPFVLLPPLITDHGSRGSGVTRPLDEAQTILHATHPFGRIGQGLPGHPQAGREETE